MTQSGDLELAGVEADGLRPPPKEMETDTPTLRLSAGQLARNLAWEPGRRESRHFYERCRILSHAIKPLLAALDSLTANTVSDDLRLLQENILLLETELEDTCEAFERPNNTPQVSYSQWDGCSQNSSAS